MTEAGRALCGTCGRPTGDGALLCPTHEAELVRLLVDTDHGADALLAALDETITRQARIGAGGRVTERPVPFDPKASAVRAALWADLVAEARVYGFDDITDGDDHDPVSWLVRQIHVIRLSQTAGDTLASIARHSSAGWRAVDRPAELWLAGVCTGGTQAHVPSWLYAPAGAAWVTCRTCGDPHEVYVLRERLVVQLAEHLLTSAELATLLSRWALAEVTREQARLKLAGWRRRGRIEPAGRTADGRDLYRVGDVLALIEAADERTTA